MCSVRLQQQMQILLTESESRLREEQFRLLVEGVPDYAIFMMDPEGRVTTWNAGAERIRRYKASEIIGQHYSRFFREEDVQSGKPQQLLDLAAREGHVEDEGWQAPGFWKSNP
jgi:PAS domain S-box-containing protein